jgi:hypothetical protein
MVAPGGDSPDSQRPLSLHHLIFTYKYPHALYTLWKGLWCSMEIITQAYKAFQALQKLSRVVALEVVAS